MKKDEFTELENQLIAEQQQILEKRAAVDRAAGELTNVLSEAKAELNQHQQNLPALVAGATLGETDNADVNATIARILYLELFISAGPGALNIIGQRQTPLINEQQNIIAQRQDVEKARYDQQLSKISQKVVADNPSTSRENIIKRVKNELPGASDDQIMTALNWKPEHDLASVTAVRKARERTLNQRAAGLGIDTTVH